MHVKKLDLDEAYGDERLVVLYGSKTTEATSERQPSNLPHLDGIRNSLLKFDLSKNEVQVYLYLARVGADRAQNVAEVLSIHRTETYKILRKLEKQGLVSCTLEKPMRFVATPFEKALTNLIESRRQHLRILERRKQEIVELWDPAEVRKTRANE